MANTLVTVVGYSQAARFDGVSFQASDETMLVAKARWRPWHRCVEFFRGGRFDEYMTSIFVELRMIRRSEAQSGEPFSTMLVYATYQKPLLFHYEARPEFCDRALCFELGEPDALDLADQFYDLWRLEIPGYVEPSGLPRDEPEVAPADLNEVTARIRERTAPYFAGLRALRDAGFSNLFIHELPPVGPVNPFPHVSARTRQKLNVLFNREFERFSNESGIPMVRTWDRLESQGMLHPKYARDSVHLNSESALASLQAIDAILRGRAGS